MPKQVKDIKEFMQLLKTEKEASTKDKSVPKKTVFVKHGKKITKFKLRKSKYLYTYQTDKQNIAKKLLDSFSSSNIQKVQLKGRRITKKKVSKN